MVQDELDQRILALLKKNGKLTNEELGTALDRSPSTIRDRVKRMEDERTILGYSIVVDEDRMGISADAYVSADVPYEKEGEALSGLLSLESVSELLHTTGERRIMFRIKAESDRDLLSLIDRSIRPLGFDNLSIMYVLDRVVRRPGV
ncbi:MAG: HTH-type transcriptional regulator Ptr2 [Methanomassiliicoccales archaeon PtaU1.Bin124]|nr:MAG: HTH-type transcriptional regulator Ptr2 [Methanomassiliicoccales archaeon PtaU1.Bin124]